MARSTSEAAAGEMLAAAEYRRLEADERKPKRLVDHTAKWERLLTVAATNGTVRERIRAFCEGKRISVEALEALGTRVKVAGNGGVELAWGYPAESKAPRSSAP